VPVRRLIVVHETDVDFRRRREPIRRRLFGAVVASLFAGSLAFAQGTASVAGTVRDASGAVLPGVTVTATQTNTGFTRTGVTDEEGRGTDDRLRKTGRAVVLTFSGKPDLMIQDAAPHQTLLERVEATERFREGPAHVKAGRKPAR